MINFGTINSSKINLSIRIIKIIFSFLLLVWCFGFLFASIFPKSGVIVIYPIIKQIYSVVCHQTGYKSFEVNGFHFLVCARCTGIYFGALVGSVLLLFIRKPINLKPRYFLVACLPILLDVFAYSTGIYSYNKIIAFITGAISGSITILYISNGFENFLQKKVYD